jgi:hypothetical protein
LPEIKNHLDSGKQVIKLAMSWADRLSFVLDESLAVKRLKFLDLIQEQAADIEAFDETEQFDADFSIMSAELAQFFRVCSNYLTPKVTPDETHLLSIFWLLTTSTVSAVTLPAPDRSGDSIIGNPPHEVKYVSAKYEDTLIDIAVEHRLGQDQIVLANPKLIAGFPEQAPKYEFHPAIFYRMRRARHCGQFA